MELRGLTGREKIICCFYYLFIEKIGLAVKLLLKSLITYREEFLSKMFHAPP